MRFDILMIGGGIVGLATAFKLQSANPRLRILLLEKEQQLAHHQTGNNSGVIHSGLYYKPGSLKARNCVNGYHQLLNFCEQESIPYQRCGKIVVATSSEEIPLLDKLEERGIQNGLKGIRKLSNRKQLQEYEPHVNGIKGLFVPQTGIINYKKVSEAYAKKFQEANGNINFGEKVINIIPASQEIIVETDHNDYKCRLVINCAGLYSDKVARLTHPELNVKIVPFRGEYYKLKQSREHLVKNLIYPVPDPNFPFLGVHFTRMIEGGIEAGPNAVLAFAREGYKKTTINVPELVETLTWPGFLKVAGKYWKTGIGEMYRSFSKAAFTRALQKLLPEIKEDDLETGGAGVRAQACDRDGGLIDDFLILESKGIINVCNAPSPAATSSLAIGDHVADLARKQL